MSIIDPRGRERNSGTRTDPHSAAATGTQPGACAAPPTDGRDNDGAPPAGSVASATPTATAAPTIPDRRTTRTADPLDGDAGRPGDRAAGDVEERTNPTLPRNSRSTTRHPDRQKRDGPRSAARRGHSGPQAPGHQTPGLATTDPSFRPAADEDQAP